MGNQKPKGTCGKRKTGDEQDGWMASQQSTNSDEALSPDLANSIMEHLYERKKKKMMEKQAKFLQMASQKLAAETTGFADRGRAATSTIDSIYGSFIADYAVIEDDIRHLWCEIRKEQQKLLILAEKRISLNMETGQEVEKLQYTGMARVKGACEEMDGLLS